MPNRDRRPPDFMDIEIKFSGRTDTIRAYFDDDPYDLAEDFVEKHRLKQSHVRVIADYIRDSIDQHLADESVQYNDSYDANDSVSRGGGERSFSSRRSDETYYRESDRSSPRPSDHATDKYSEPSSSSRYQQSSSPLPQQAQSAPQQPPPPQQSAPPQAQQPQQQFSSMDTDRRSPTAQSGLPPLHPPLQHRDPTSAELPPTAKSVSISRTHSESPINVTSPPPASSTTAAASNGLSSASRARLNSNTTAESSIAYGRTRQNSTASAVGLLTRRNSEDLTPNRYSVRSPEYYLEPHADDDTSAFDRGSFRRHSEAVPLRDRMDSMSAEYSPIRRDDSTSPFQKIDEGDENSVGDNGFPRDEDDDIKMLSDDDDVPHAGGGAGGRSNSRNRSRNQGNGNGDDDDDDDEARIFENLRDQAGMDTVDDEDEEAQLYERLQRGGGSGFGGSGGGGGGGNMKSLMAGLKPVSRSLEMGKKSMLPNAPAMNNPSKLNAQKQGIVGKSVSDRLHHTAELMRKKKEMLTKKAALEEQKKLEANKFQLNRHSQEIAERNMGARYKDGHHLTDTLYQEGLKAVEEKKQKAQEVAKQRETLVRDWSCVKCGTFHAIPSTTSTGISSGGGASGGAGAGAGKWVVPRELKCTKCGWNQQEAAPSFTPVNVGLTLHEDPQWLKNRQVLVEEEGQGSVHQYLYQTGMQREKILHFNRELWEEIEAQLPFAPTLPESSKRILKKYKRGVPGQGQGNGIDGGGVGGDGQGSTTSSITASYAPSGVSERDDATLGGMSLSTHYRFNARLTGPALHDYLNRPTVERLVSTQTRSMAEEALLRHQQVAQTGPISMATVEEREKRLNDLVYEYEAKEKRLKEAERHQLARDPVTGQRLFHPKVPDIPDELRSGRMISVGGGSGGGQSATKGCPIWEKLVEKNKESEAKKLLMQRKAVEKTLAELQAHQVRALPTSNEILQESTSRNIAVLFRLLLAHTRGGDLSTSPSPELIPPSTTGSDRESSSPEPDQPQQQQQQQQQQQRRQTPSQSQPQQVQRGRKATSTAARSNATTAAAANANANAPANGAAPAPVIDVDRIHRISQNIQQWEAMTLDLAMVQPALMVNEVSTLLMDMKKLRWNEVQRAANGAAAGGSGRIVDTDMTTTMTDDPDASSSSLVVTFAQFKDLALKCIRFRNGPGRGYVFAPKKKPEVALQLKEAQEQEETFRPTIDARSQELTKPRQEAYRRIPIEDMLHADGQKVQKRIEAERNEKERREQAALSFQPTLYQPPPYVVPKYRGMDLDALDDAIARDEEDLLLNGSREERWRLSGDGGEGAALDDGGDGEDDDDGDDGERCFDDDEDLDDPTRHLPVSLAHKVSTLQASTQAPVFASGNGNVHFPPKPLPPVYDPDGRGGGRDKETAAAAAAAAAVGSSSKPPTTAAATATTKRPPHRSLQTPAEVRYHRFTQQQLQAAAAAAQPPSAGSSPGRSPSQVAADDETEEAIGAAGEVDSHASWGLAPEDVVSSSSRSDVRYATRPPPLPATVTQRRGGGGGYGADDGEGPSHRRLHVEELQGGGAGGHPRRSGIDRSTPPPPPPLPEGLSTGSFSPLTVDHYHDNDYGDVDFVADDDGGDESTTDSRSHPQPHGAGALQLTRGGGGGGGGGGSGRQQPHQRPRSASRGRKSTAAVAAHHPHASAAATAATAAGATGPSAGGSGGAVGGGGGGYLQRMMSTKSNRSQSSNHSLTISRSNNSSFVSHAKAGGGAGGGSARTGRAQQALVPTAIAGDDSFVEESRKQRKRSSPSPPPPPPPPATTGVAAAAAATPGSTSQKSHKSQPRRPPQLPQQSTAVAAMGPAGLPLLPIEQQQLQSVPVPVSVAAQHQHHHHHATSQHHSGRMSVASGISTITASTVTTVVKKK